MGHRKYFLIALASAAIFLASAGCSSAKTYETDNILMTYSDPLFNVLNAAPGQESRSPITVKNKDGKPNNFQFEITADTTPLALAQLLYLRIEDSKGNCPFGCDRNYSLAELDKAEVKVQNLPSGETQAFDLVLKFDEKANDDFQNVSTTFDVTLGFEGVAPAVGGGRATRRGGGGPGGGPAGPGAGLFVRLTGAGGAIAGEESISGQELPGQIQGEEARPGRVEGISVETCQGWPKWVWILILIAYFGAFLWRTFEKITEQIAKREIRWKWQAALAAAAFLVWYFFDKCREFQWFVIIALVGGAIIFLFYLFLFGKSIREQQTKIDNGSKEAPPQAPENHA